jgi:5-amino-6-(5-phosphoribosylamino)uracil reductase
VLAPYTLLSCAISADGCLDDASPGRLILSGPEDLDAVDELRSTVDAILIGAGTVRADDSRLLIRSQTRQKARTERGLPAHPRRVTLTANDDLDPDAHIFTGPGAPPLVYCPPLVAERLRTRLGDRAEVVGLGHPLTLRTILADLAERRVRRLLIEGGAQVLAQALQAGIADELRLAVAPFFVGDPAAPRFAPPGTYQSGPATPMTLATADRLGPVTVARYLLGPGGADRRFLAWAIELSRLCPPSQTAFSVGAVIVSADGEVLSTGYSRELDPHDHAEEVALRTLGPDPRLAGATLYSSLIPCGARASREVTCVRHTVAADISRVVYGWDEPPVFAPGDGGDQLRAAGVEVIQIPDLAPRAAEVNEHLID